MTPIDQLNQWVLAEREAGAPNPQQAVLATATKEAIPHSRVVAVREALVARGVPGDLMTGEAFGESKPAKPTADGVKEPLNRRTEVTFTFQ
jgi:hypothetical protein